MPCAVVAPLRAHREVPPRAPLGLPTCRARVPFRPDAEAPVLSSAIFAPDAVAPRCAVHPPGEHPVAHQRLGLRPSQCLATQPLRGLHVPRGGDPSCVTPWAPPTWYPRGAAFAPSGIWLHQHGGRWARAAQRSVRATPTYVLQPVRALVLPLGVRPGRSAAPGFWWSHNPRRLRIARGGALELWGGCGMSANVVRGTATERRRLEGPRQPPRTPRAGAGTPAGASHPHGGARAGHRAKRAPHPHLQPHARIPPDAARTRPTAPTQVAR